MSEFDWNSHKTGNDKKFDVIGDSVTGKIVRIRQERSKYKDGNVVVLDIMPDGAAEPVAVWLGSTDLLAKVAEKDPQVSDKIRITFSETLDTGRGNPMKVFTVMHRQGERPQPEPDFDDEPSGNGTVDTEDLSAYEDLPF